MMSINFKIFLNIYKSGIFLKIDKLFINQIFLLVNNFIILIGNQSKLEKFIL